VGLWASWNPSAKILANLRPDETMRTSRAASLRKLPQGLMDLQLVRACEPQSWGGMQEGFGEDVAVAGGEGDAAEGGEGWGDIGGA